MAAPRATHLPSIRKTTSLVDIAGNGASTPTVNGSGTGTGSGTGSGMVTGSGSGSGRGPVRVSSPLVATVSAHNISQFGTATATATHTATATAINSGSGSGISASVGSPANQRSFLKVSASSPNIFTMNAPSPATPCTSDELPPVKVEEATSATGRLLSNNIRVGGLIGTGSYGAVYTCSLEAPVPRELSRVGGNALAIKIISKARLNRDGDGAALLKKEIKIMSLLDNPNIVRLHHSWSDADNYYLLMDHAPRGDAFDVVELYTKGTPEPLCARIMSQLLTALAYLHSMGIVHRDVKPENLFIDNAGNVLLGDFGLADVVPTRKDGGRERLQAVCGSETYQAPEMIIDRSYGVEVDLWSAGLTMYTLITGRDPWKKLDRQLTTAELRKKVGTAAYNALPSHISKTAADLLNRMLAIRPEERITAQEGLEHKWMLFADFA